MIFRKLHLLVALITFTVGAGSMAMVRYIEARIDSRHPISQIEPLASRSLLEERLEEQAVYRAIIRKLYLEPTTRLITIGATSVRYTSYEVELAESSPRSDIFKGLRQTTGLDKEATDDYLVKNETPSQLEIGTLGVDCKLVSDDEINQLFGDGRLDWASFYERYRGSSGLIYFSRVGFNSAHNQAFVYVAHGCGGLCGEGSYLVLEKRGSEWIITQSEGIWIS
jgi:hypothetical protein